MKRSNIPYSHSSQVRPAYPNAADANYYKRKLLEALAGLLSGAALTGFLILLTAFL